jgi:hypothetical protein
MLKRQSSQGMNPRMAGIMGCFQILWIWYGDLIGSDPVIVWSIIAVVINLLVVCSYLCFSRLEAKAIEPVPCFASALDDDLWFAKGGSLTLGPATL